MRANRAMMVLLGKGEALGSSDSLPEDLDRFLAKGMSVVDDCLIIGELKPHLRSAREKMDRTGFESFVNHAHLDEKKNDATTVLRQAIAFSRRVALEAHRIAPGRSIRFIISRSGQDWTVHLHTLRLDEPDYVAEDLEGYREEEVLVLDSPELLPTRA